jgi:hypothetical protein
MVIQIFCLVLIAIGSILQVLGFYFASRYGVDFRKDIEVGARTEQKARKLLLVGGLAFSVGIWLLGWQGMKLNNQSDLTLSGAVSGFLIVVVGYPLLIFGSFTLSAWTTRKNSRKS